jgi:hypothetical protein
MKSAKNFPGETPFTGTKNPLLPHVLVGDEGFGISSKLLRPFERKNCEEANLQLSFNKSQALQRTCFRNFSKFVENISPTL